MTAGPAFAAFQEKDLGSLSVGRYADFTVVSANPYSVPPDDLRTLTIRMTVVAGRATFDAGKKQAKHPVAVSTRFRSPRTLIATGKCHVGGI